MITFGLKIILKEVTEWQKFRNEERRVLHFASNGVGMNTDDGNGLHLAHDRFRWLVAANCVLLLTFVSKYMAVLAFLELF
jgi:hypothetical protein